MITEIQIDWRGPGYLPGGEGSVVANQLNDVVDEALSKARAAFAHSRANSIRHRLMIVTSFRARLAGDAGAIARKLSREAQRSPEEVLASEIIPLLDACRFLEKSAAKLLRSRTHGRWSMPLWLMGTHHQVIREPLGVVLVIGASNYPLFLPAVQVLQAIVAGNSVLLKAAPTGMGSSSVLLDLLRAAGMPANLVQALPSSANSALLAIGQKVDKVFFTGSAETGRKVLIHAATALTPAVMELSGCDATFVLPDAEVDLATRSIAYGLTLNSGRTCIAPRRAFVWDQVLAEFSGKLKSELQARPKIFTRQSPNSGLIENFFEALSRGASVLNGSVTKDGVVEGPLVLTGLRADSPFARAENWGANLSIIPVSSEEEAIRCYDLSDFALGASIFSRSHSCAQRMARKLQAGSVCINDLIVPTADGRLPFSGRKQSGFGAARGQEGLLEMTAPKVISFRRGGAPLHLRPPEKNQFQILSAYCGAAYGAGHERFRSFRKILTSVFGRDDLHLNERTNHE